MYCGDMAVPHVDNNQTNKRWGDEVAFSELEQVIPDTEKLEEHRGRVEEAGRLAAARLRATATEQQ